MVVVVYRLMGSSVSLQVRVCRNSRHGGVALYAGEGAESESAV